MQEKILTVIVPTYNMERYLDRCLSSLIVDNSSKMDSLEVIVVNDGSTDKSSEIAHSFESRYPETFKVMDKPNANYGSCINVALPLARGKYVKILDADDFFDTQLFSKFISILMNCQADMVLTDMREVDISGNAGASHSFEGILPEQKVIGLASYAKAMNGVGFYMQNVTYLTGKLVSAGYKQTEGISYTDQEWLFLPISLMESAEYYPVCLYNYLVGRTGQTVDMKVHRKNMWMEIEGTRVMLEEWEDMSGRIEDRDVFNFFYGRLLARIRTIYVMYLLKSSKYEGMQALVSFDRYLSEKDSGLYEMAGALNTAYGFPYVRKWREKYSTTNIVFAFIALKNKIS